jgi:hypothetical protein
LQTGRLQSCREAVGRSVDTDSGEVLSEDRRDILGYACNGPVRCPQMTTAYKRSVLDRLHPPLSGRRKRTGRFCFRRLWPPLRPAVFFRNPLSSELATARRWACSAGPQQGHFETAQNQPRECLLTTADPHGLGCHRRNVGELGKRLHAHGVSP